MATTHQFSIKVRLGLSLGVPLVSLIILMGVVAGGINSMRDEIEQGCQRGATLALLAQQMKLNAVQVQQFLTDISATRGLDGLNDGFDDAEENRKAFLSGLAEFRRVFEATGATDQIARLNEIDRAFADYFEAGSVMAHAYVEGGTAQGNKFMGPFDKMAERMVLALDPFVADQVSGLSSVVADIQARTAQMVRLILAGAMVAAVISLIFLFTSLRAIRGPLAEAVRYARSIASGDLRQTLAVRSNDELGELAAAMNVMATSLDRTIRQTAENARQLERESDQLTDVSKMLRCGTEKTASEANTVSTAATQMKTSIGTVVASAEELSISIRDIAQQASAAARISTEAAGLAKATHQTITTLGKSGETVSGVVELIRSIAVQTDLLALNAAIEAARAGESGRGFAVVAHAVKELAQRTTNATGDICAQVEAMQLESSRAVAAIGQITDVIARVKDIQARIALSVEKQTEVTSGIAQISSELSLGSAGIAQGIGSVSAATDDLNRAAGTTADSARQLGDMCEILNEAVSHFQLRETMS